MLEWVSEGTALPEVGQVVLLATPRQFDEFWDIRTSAILIRHEGVRPRPVAPGATWPTDYYWGCLRGSGETSLITGNGWWASMTGLPLPPLAEHRSIRGYDCIVQTGDAFVKQAPRP